MNEEILVIPLCDREKWSSLHQEGGRPSQSWHYCWALNASGVDPMLAVVRSGGACMMMPFFVREWRESADVCTVHGLSGASMDVFSSRPLKLWNEFAEAQGWVAGYIQFEAGTVLPADTIGEVGTSNQVFLLDLRNEDPLAGASCITRRKIRKASKIEALLVEDRHLLTGALIDLYPATMGRVGASAHYGFSAETLRRWASDPDTLLLGALVERSIQAIILLLVAGRCAEYHIGASTERGRDLTTWLLKNGIERLRGRGVATLNLGGGIRPADGLYRFKAKFGAVPKPLQAIHQIYDPNRYNELCRMPRVKDPVRYFPAYRAHAAFASVAENDFAILKASAQVAMAEFLKGLPEEESGRYSPLAIRHMLDGARPDLYALQVVKCALVRHLGLRAAGLIYLQATQRQSDHLIEERRLVGLQEFCISHGESYEELAPSKDVCLRSPNVFGAAGKGPLSAISRTMFFCVLRDVCVSSKSNFILADDAALLDFQAGELEKCPLNLDVDPLVMACEGNVAIIQPKQAAGLRHFECALYSPGCPLIRIRTLADGVSPKGVGLPRPAAI